MWDPIPPTTFASVEDVTQTVNPDRRRLHPIYGPRGDDIVVRALLGQRVFEVDAYALAGPHPPGSAEAFVRFVLLAMLRASRRSRVLPAAAAVAS